MFHAVSLDGDIDLAKVLAFGVPRLREGVARVENASLELTAIVEPWRELQRADEEAEDEDRLAQYRFGVESMEAAEIRVLTTGDLPRVADTARFEMKL